MIILLATLFVTNIRKQNYGPYTARPYNTRRTKDDSPKEFVRGKRPTESRLHILNRDVAPRSDSVEALLYGVGPVDIVVTGALEVMGEMEIKLPGPVRDIDLSGAPGVELDGSNDAGRSSKVRSIYCNNDVSSRRGKME